MGLRYRPDLKQDRNDPEVDQEVSWTTPTFDLFASDAPFSGWLNLLFLLGDSEPVAVGAKEALSGL